MIKLAVTVQCGIYWYDEGIFFICGVILPIFGALSILIVDFVQDIWCS